jgi:hypothetical protein
MSRKFSWYKSRYLSSEGLEVVPAEGIEFAFRNFSQEPKPLPEPPKKKGSLYLKALNGLYSHIEQARERTNFSWRKRVFGVQLLWLLAGFAIFAVGVGLGGFIAAMAMASKRNGPVIIQR